MNDNISHLLGSQPIRKKKVLVHSDFCGSTTGFGVVSKYILKALHSTGRYDIHQLAINYFTEFYDKKEYPYTVVPARLNDPRDPYGLKMLLRSLDMGDYDYLFVINDAHVIQPITEQIRQIQLKKKNSQRKVFKIIYYYPVDCWLIPGTHSLIQLADRAVAYSHFAAEHTKKLLPNKPDAIIYHGVDTEAFHPIPDTERQQCRKRYLGIEDPNKVVVVAAGRNSLRKDMSRAILAFSEFKKRVPNSMMYCHMAVEDGSNKFQRIDLNRACSHLHLKPREDIIFPENYSPAMGFSEKVLNQLLCCGDIYLSTTLGEGFGLYTLQLMSCGVPVVVGNNTVHPEILGKYSERGFLYDCKELTFIDNSGFRPVGQLEDIVDTMIECYEGKKLGITQMKVRKAMEWAHRYTWDNIGKEWVKLFEGLDREQSAPVATQMIEMEEV